MPFIVVPIEPDDGLEWCHVHYSAFSQLLGCLWKHQPTEENFQEMAKQRMEGLNDPNTHAFKAVDTTTGRIAGVAKWMVYPQERTTEEVEKSLEEAPYTSDINREARQSFMSNINKSRWDILGTQPSVVLGALVVRPEYQRQGVGHLLMEWGTNQADKLGLVGYLESSKNGFVLYQRFGYRPHSTIQFDTRPYGGEGIDTHTLGHVPPTKTDDVIYALIHTKNLVLYTRGCLIK